MFVAELGYNPHGHAPARDRISHDIGKVRHCRHDNLDRTKLMGNAGHCGAEDRCHAANFTAPAAGQNQDQRRIREAQPSLKIFGPQVVETFGEWMSHVGARRPAKLLHDLWFKWQQRQHLIHISAHGSRAPRTPCPDGRTDIVDDWNIACVRPHAFGHAMGKLGTVDDDQSIGLRRNHSVGRFTNALQDFWQARRNCRKADDRKIPERKKARHARSGQVSTADSGKLNAPIGALPDRVHERGTQSITGFFPGDQKNMRTHGSVPDGTPTAKIALRSASSMSRAGSATMVLPASTAMPASPARTAPSTVCGPIDGRSNRRSCAGFGAFTRMPVPDRARRRPFARISATRESMASVPSAASTARMWRPATTAACPMSNFPAACKYSSPSAMSPRSSSDGCTLPRVPSGISISGATSWAPTSRRPPSSSSLPMLLSKWLSPPR